MSNIPDDEDREAASRLAENLFANMELGDTEEAMVTMHEMFLSLQKGGFSEYQALWLIGYLMSNGSGKSDDSPS